jgi:uncharacterized membrane protein
MIANIWELLQTSYARLVIWAAILAILSVVGYYVVRRFRDESEDNETSSEMLTKFQDSRVRGELNEAEFRTIKTILAERMQAELKQEDDSS